MSPQTSFLIQLLQFTALLTLRHDRSSGLCPSPSSITSRRQANHTRAERWREAAGSEAWPSQLLNIYSSTSPAIGRDTARHGVREDGIRSEEIWRVEEGNGYQRWNEDDRPTNEQTSNGKSKDNSRNSFRNDNGNSNGDNNANNKGRHEGSHQGKVNQEQAPSRRPDAARDERSDFVTLLDLLPMFMNLTATIMSTGLHDQTTPTPSSPTSPTSPTDDQDKSSTSTTSELVWASEPQWLTLAANFMLQAVLEQYLSPSLSLSSSLSSSLQATGFATSILDAFSWGKFPAVHAEPFSTNQAKDNAAMTATRSMTIPDSDEGDITALGTTPLSSPDHTPSSHPSLFVMQSEDSSGSAGATWRRLRLQALSLLEPPEHLRAYITDHRAHIQDHLRLLSQHHKYSDFETSMLEFLAHLFHSRQPPLLTQLETVYPAWMASGPPGMGSQTQGMQMQSQSHPQPQVQSQTQTYGQAQGQSLGNGGNRAQPADRNRKGWLAAAHLTVRAGSMELTEEEVDTLMHMLSMQWFCA